MPFDPATPYNDLPDLPPGHEVETPAVLKRCVDAARALAELKGVGETIPNQAMLINAIPLQEARLSSEIENIVTTQDELFKAALDEANATDPHAKEVLRYRTALREGYESLHDEPLSLALIERLCRTLRNDASIRFRATEGVIIGNPTTRQAFYTPPVGDHVIAAKLRNLEDYLLAPDGPDPLIRLAVSHYQFEAIHPFTDGNGRTGRILNILYLLHTGLLSIPVLYLSRYIIQNKNAYYRHLQAVTEDGAWESWILYVLAAIRETAEWTTSRITSIRDLHAVTVEKCRDALPRGVYSRELIDTIFAEPYCKIAFVGAACQVERKTASKYLQELKKLGILESEKVGSEMIYKHPALLRILTE